MPNERNIEALIEVIASTGLTPQHDSWLRAIAKALASRGVLVPSALTPTNAHQLTLGFDDGAYYLSAGPDRDHAEAHTEIVARLERIAKGEG